VGRRQTFYRSERLGGLTDGVFAIALTLLVLELKIPDNPNADSSVLDVLVRDWETFAGWFISFVILARLWMFQHHAAASARFVSSRSIAINFGFLAAVSLIPFTAHLVGLYELSQPLVLQLFSGLIAVVSVMLGWFMRSVQRDQVDLGRVSAESMAVTRDTIHHLLWAPLIAVVAIVASIIDPRIGLTIWAVESMAMLVVFLRTRSDGDLHIYAPEDKVPDFAQTTKGDPNRGRPSC
jgi:uncharacterized membrane protein